MKNKKGGIADFIILIIFILLSIAMVLLVLTSQKNLHLRQQKCNNAIDSDTKTSGTFFETFTGKDKLTCICYYKDKIKTIEVRK